MADFTGFETSPEQLESLRQREPQAWADFIQQRREALLGYIQRRLGAALRRKVEPDDIFQETSAEALRALTTTELGERDPFGWLCHLAERRIIDAHRRYFGAQKRDAGREVPLGSPGGAEQSRAAVIDMLVMSMTTASQAFSRDQRQMKLHDALQELPHDQREALRLRYVEGMPSKEIAERLGKTDGAVRVMLTRSLAKLHTILGPDAAPR